MKLIIWDFEHLKDEHSDHIEKYLARHGIRYQFQED